MLYFLRMIKVSLMVTFKRIFGRKHFPTWNLKTELMWATSRTTLLSSADFGLQWLKDISIKFTPEPKLAKQIKIDSANTPAGEYLSIQPIQFKSPSKRLIIYFHGGGYVMNSPRISMEFLSRLSLTTDTIVLAPFYPQAPEAAYPAAHESALNSIKALLDAHPESQIYLAGDSAGAALLLSSFINLEEKLRQRISGCLILSPWIEPLAQNGSIDLNSTNDIGDRNFLVSCYELYMNGKQSISQYPVDFSNIDLPTLPASFISVGTAEMLLDQTTNLVKHLQANKTKVDFKTYTNMFHSFWNMAPAVPEAEQLLQDIAEWLKAN